MSESGPIVAVFGGTFDPFHKGHLQSALELLQRLPVTEVRLVPAARPNLRDTPDASDHQRLDMVTCATAAFPGLIVDARELSRPGTTFTIDTLREMHREWPDTRLLLVLGTDAFNGIASWRESRQIWSLCAVLVMQRPGHLFTMPDSLEQKTAIVLDGNEQRLQGCAPGELYRITLQQWPLSATEVRERLQRGENVDGMVPPVVGQYIEEHGLYRQTGAA